MSTIWMAFALIVGVMAIIGEFVMGMRERRVREVLEQPLDREGRERKRLYRMLFITSLMALFLGLSLSGAHRQFFGSVQGVAVVIDTKTLPSESNPSQQLAVEKGAVIDLIRRLPGVTLSLYELRGSAVHLVVPPTIDRLFFELQLDGIVSSPSMVSGLTLSAIQNDVVGRFPGIPPWVVVVGPMALAAGKEGLDAVASIEVSIEGVRCALREVSLSFNGLTVGNTAVKILERLNRSAMPTVPDSTESFLMALCTGLAWLCFVMWRRGTAPLFALGMALASFSQAFSVTDVGANAMVQDAVHLAEAHDFTGSQRAIEELLTTVVNPQARQRLLYDRALLSYLQNNDADALQWLNMEPPSSPNAAIPQRDTLLGLIATRLVETSADHQTQLQQKKILREWLQQKPKVPKEIAAAATLALFSPAVDVTDLEAVRRTLRWLEENMYESIDGGSSSLTTAAFLLAQQMNDGVEGVLAAAWPKEVLALFSFNMGQRQKTISTIRIWYDFAASPTVNEGIKVLLDQASLSAHRAIYFPKEAAAAKEDLALVSAILTAAIPALAEQQQRVFSWLLGLPTGDGEQRAASWYARAVLWPAMQNNSPQQLKPMAMLLCQEIDVPSSMVARKALATLVASVLSLSGSSLMTKDPLEELLHKALAFWYVQDPGDAIDTVLLYTEKDPERWTPRLFALIMPYLLQARAGGQSLSAVMARGVGDEPMALDPVLTGRLWQVAQGAVDTPQAVSWDIDHLEMLFSELSSRLSSPNDSALRSLVLIFSIQPLIFGELNGAEIFQNNQKKRATYDQLLGEWNAICGNVQQRIAEPSTFRLQKVKQEVEASAGVLRRLQALLRESATEPEASQMPEVRSGELGKNFSIRGEDAIHLFQQMDRSDRELYGE